MHRGDSAEQLGGSSMQIARVYRNRGLQAGSGTALMRPRGWPALRYQITVAFRLTSQESVSLAGGSEHPVGCGIT
jgi:hypothetical protein